MPDTNFDLAPPVKTVDGLKAVPIDIQKITATLTFDGATSSGNGDATLEFITGPVNGNPIFDLRQTITSAWLDGVAIPLAKLAHHDFGGGEHAQLRIVESVLPANSTHTLRVKYSLGTPQASTAGQYQPAMTWSSGPRLVFNFGFTDLGAGRYLEAWVPANLIFDQFELVLTLRVLNTAVAHTVITNGTVASLGANHWSVAFPARFTAFSPLLELRAANTLTSLSGTKLLPVSNTTVNIEVWKLTSNAVDLTTQLNNLKNYLAANETAIGPYLHGNRFVAFMQSAAMEYDGGTTSGSGSLRHEAFHSWCARGLKPASQPDAWWDEAWTMYNMSGASGSTPFNFSNPPFTLCTRNPWVRITADGSYTNGENFFKGVAALIGVAKLNSLMSAFYKERNQRPATTTDLEEFLVCQSGNLQLVDAFHRFVYGFADPAPAPDLWLHDDPAHAGANDWAGNFWDSPDLWIRHKDDGGTTHQNPEFGRDNWFYARIHNRSATATAKHFLVTFNVKQFAGVEFHYPADFLPCIAAASGFELKPNTSTIVKARWPKAFVPPPGSHPCWLAAVFTRFDNPLVGRNVWEHNNLAQKNLTVVDLQPGDWMVLPFVLNNLKPLARRVTLELLRPEAQTKIAATLMHKTADAFRSIRDAKIQPLADITDSTDASPADAEPAFECGGRAVTQSATDNGILTSRASGTMLAEHFAGGVETPFTAGRAAGLPVSLSPTQQLVLGLRVTAPPAAKSGEVFRLDLVQKGDNGKSIVGGIAVEIRIK